MYSKPHIIQGVFFFEGCGLAHPRAVSSELSYIVPTGKRTQFVYFRAGNSSPELVYVVLLRDEMPMRYFPIGAKSDTHVALAVVEDLMSGTSVNFQIAAPEGTMGTLVLDIGLVEI